ncbi:MAG: hypothetical protein ACTHJH_01885 [Marmoricola sp.]
MQKNTAKKNTKRVAIVGGTVAALLGGGIAFAAWTSTGHADGTATAAAEKGLGVSAPSVSGLFPTGSQTQAVTVTNKNDYPVTLSGLTATVTDHDKNTCKVTAVLADGPATGRIPSMQSTTYHFTVAMGPESDDSCQNGNFTIGYDATAGSSN